MITNPGDKFLPEEDELVLAMANSVRRPDWKQLSTDMKAMGYNRTNNSLILRKRLIFKPAGGLAQFKREKSAAREAIRCEKSKARVKKWQVDKPEMSRAKAKRHREAHKHEEEYKLNQKAREARGRAKTTAREMKRYHLDAAFNAIKKARMRLTNLVKVKGAHKKGRTTALLQCTAKQLAVHLNRQRPADDIRLQHMDHIFPLAKYAIAALGQQAKAMHYSNLQPLTKKENLDKSDKLPTKAMAAKVERWAWPDGVTEDMLPDIYPGWSTALRM